ncbi:hypothetical protein DMC30DRAFT_415849 [Rhodotorula diobovata]|uniref:Uncharacterized protein n=1 Tax=Rhodotorula diobovata TaxID=5288 RepID=A0A5C5FZS7_9BASI|nr:hypothetical protein DMC30DRAFT_415849 [Rhodotorula diobovata]
MHLEHPPPCPPTCTHCLAFDNHARAVCTLPPSPNSKWCKVHEELQAKLLKTYKRLTGAFEAHDNSLLPASVDEIVAEPGLATLRRWSEEARHRWSLARRVIVARAEHHAQFYAGGDWGHCRFVETVRAESVRMERFLCALDQQAYTVTLHQQAASWVLDVASGPAFICDDAPISPASGESTERPLTPPPSPPTASPALPRGRGGRRHNKGRQIRPSAPFPLSSASNDALDELLASPAATLSIPAPRDLLARLRDYLVPPTDLPPTVSVTLWTSFVEAVFRHVVLRVPALATLALSALSQSETAAGPLGRAQPPHAAPPASVQAFLDLLESRLGPAFVPDGAPPGSAPGEREVELLWRGLKFARAAPSSAPDSSDACSNQPEEGLLGVNALADALDAVFAGASCPPGTDSLETGDAADGASVVLLGARVQKIQNRVEWPRPGWDLFYQLVACPGCTLVATHSLTTWTANRRLAALGRYPSWAASSESTAERVFRLSGAVLCTSNSCTAGKKIRRVEQKGPPGKKATGKKTVFLEETERSWMYIKLPFDDPRSRRILDHLASRSDRFAVLARQTISGPLTHVPPKGDMACVGYIPAERKAARWTTTSFLPQDSILSSFLKSSSPELRFHDAPFSDTYDALVLDATRDTHDKWATFADAVAQAILHAQECETIGQLLHREKEGAVERGEMDAQRWERLHTHAVIHERGGRQRDGQEPRRKVAFVCEETLTARRIFREE